MRLGYVIIYVPEVDAALAFYERAFGLARRFLHESGLYGELDTGATALAFAAEDLVSATCHTFRPNRPDNEAAGAEVGLIVEDVPAAYARALSAGAEAFVSPVTKPWGQVVAYVRDLNGFLVELFTKVGK